MTLNNRLSLILLALFLAACVPAESGVDPESTPEPVRATIAQFNGWLDDVRDPALAPLITPAGESYRLDPDWEVDTIEYVYQTWGFETALEYREIVFRDGSYFLDNRDVGPKVMALLAAVDDLYTGSSALGSYAMSDDYPTWTVELTGKDGRRLLLFASSTGTVGNGPWTVLDNGRLYNQFNGALAGPLASLFGGWLTLAEKLDENAEPVYFDYHGRPLQTEGFYGLLPLSEDFFYHLNLETNSIEGVILGQMPAGLIGLTKIGSLNALHDVRLQPPTGPVIDCTISDTVPGYRPSAAAWSFSCPVEPPVVGDRYRYEIAVGYSIGDDLADETAGVLWGIWRAERPFSFLGDPALIESVLIGSEKTEGLWSDHIILDANVTGQVDPLAPFEDVTLAGEVVLAGQAEIDGRLLRYTIGTPIVIEAGQLIRWDLTRAIVDELVAEIGALSLTDEAEEALGDVILNLWYAQVGETSSQAGFHGGRLYKIDMDSACKRAPEARTLPDSQAALRGFSYNAEDMFFLKPQFLLLESSIVVDCRRLPGY